VARLSFLKTLHNSTIFPEVIFPTLLNRSYFLNNRGIAIPEMYAVAVARVVSRDSLRGKQSDTDRHFFSAQHSAEMLYYFYQLPVLELRIAKSRIVPTEGKPVNAGSQVGLT
jgi:hypothetical protein